ncbi:MAG TPA: GDSL-type esterase/lipase family protein, partial [Gammaproteobacteria bacterium]|nr:GDSL-type esterase/lipase family protein [Gammaproteobacteria bacterium]
CAAPAGGISGDRVIGFDMRVCSWLFVAAALIGALLRPFAALGQNAFESEIQAYEAQDKTNPPPHGSVVVTGSSSIVKWTTIQTDLAPLDVIPRGFGGSTTDDLDYYLQRIVLVYQPRAVVIYEGENDIDNGQTPTYVANRMAGILARISAALPNARVYVISIKPSPFHIQLWAGWETWANQQLAALCATDARYTYIDVASHLIYSDGTPNPTYYDTDGVHLTWQGYQVWTNAIRPVLLAGELPSADSTPPTVPGGLKAAAQSSSRIDLSWNAATDSGSGVGGYNVFRNGTKVATTTSTSYSDTGLTSNTLYTYTVTAFDRVTPNHNESAQSAPSSATTQTTAQPAPTVSLQVSPSTVAIGGTTQLTWTSTNASACTASGGWAGAQAASGSAKSSALSSNTTFTLTCSGNGGSASDTKAVAVVGPPTVSLAVSPATVASGGTTQLSWTTSSATSCTASGGWSGTKTPVGGETSSALSSNTAFTLTCTGVGGTGSDSKTVTVTAAPPPSPPPPSPPPPTVQLSDDSPTLAYGGTEQLKWSSTNAASCNASGAWTGSRGTSGAEATPALTASSTFALTCTGPGGNATSSVSIAVGAAPAPTTSLTANPTSVAPNGTTALSWTTTNATACTASNGWAGSRPASGTETSSALTGTTTFALVCTGPGGTSNASVDVTVVYPEPTVELNATPGTVSTGTPAKLSWTTQDASDCSASGAWNGKKPLAGDEMTAPIATQSAFSLSCSGPGGSADVTVTVKVQDSPAPSDTTTVTAKGGGGGGAVDWWDVSALLALLALRRVPDRALRGRRSTSA